MSRIRSPFKTGTITNNPLAIGGTSISSAGLANLPVVTAPDVMALVLDPTGVGGDPEIVHVTAHSSAATTATITRAAESSVARQHANGVAWLHGATVEDFKVFLGAGISADANSTLVYDTTAAALKVWNGSASQAIEVTLNGAAQKFVEAGTYKQFHALGGPAGDNHNYVNTDLVGMGFVVVETGTGAVAANPTDTGTDGQQRAGQWLFDTAATNGSDAGVVGPKIRMNQDWTLVWRGSVPATATQEVFIGFTNGSVVNFIDKNDSIGFRISGAGNIIGFTDSAGVETTRDAGATAATECTLRIEIRNNGTLLRLYRNNAQLGADITTNLLSATDDFSLGLSCGIDNLTAGASRVMRVTDLFCWREVGIS